MRQWGGGQVSEPKSGAITVVEILDRFLHACRKDAAPRTFEGY
jgi:hypothetical protein